MTTQKQWDETLNSKESQDMLSDIEKQIMKQIEDNPSLFVKSDDD